MPIRNVGGQSVYVIDAPQIDAARTSTGLGYAQLVSQLRWKIWEEAEKQVARQLELEKMGYQAQLDAYVKQKQELTRALTKTKDLKEKVAKGDVTLSQAISLANADAVTDRANQALRVKFGTEKVYERPVIDPLTGKPIPGEKLKSYSYTMAQEGQEFKPVAKPSSRVGQIAEQLGVDTPEDRKAAAEAAKAAEVKSLESDWMNRFKTANPQGLSAEAWSQSPEGAEVQKALADARQELDAIKGTPASQFKAPQDAAAESDLDDFAAQLQAEIDALEAPSLGFDTNVLSRTRETFGGMAGVGGFGFAPRRSKISPIYDEGRAREALGRQDVLAEEFITATEAAERKNLEARALQEKERRRASRLAELETVVGPLASPEEVAKAAEEAGILNLMDTSTLTPDERMRLNRVARERAEAAYRESALLAGPGLRTAGTFMDIPREEVSLDGFTRTERGPRQPREPRERFPREPRERPLRPDGGEVERFPSPSPSPFGPSGTTSRPPNIYDLEFMGAPPPPAPTPAPSPPPFNLPTLDASGMPISPAPSTPPPAPSTPAPAPLPPPPPPPPAAPPVAPPAGQPAAPSGSSGSGKEDLGGGVVYDRISGVIFGKDGFPIFVINKPINPNTAAPYQPEVISREEMNKKVEEIRAAGGYEIKGSGPQKLEKSGAVKPKTRQEKYAASSFSIVKAGSALADRPAKLARLAKLDLPEKERSRQVPEHILLVDKIYGINKGKANAYKATFDEIARVYKSDEKKKKEAQEYLTATHLLYSEGLA